MTARCSRGPTIAGGNATTRGGDVRPRLAIVRNLGAPLEDAELYLVHEEALDVRRGGRALRKPNWRTRHALMAGPSSPQGDLDRWLADVLVVRPAADPH